MLLDWLDWSNPVAVWWSFLVTASALNIVLLLVLRASYRRNVVDAGKPLALEPLFVLASTYALVCAFRSILPRADVQRICLFDTWLSSVLVGRSVATIAELCFAMQWAIVLRELARVTRSDTAKNIAATIVPLIVVAECCSWYAVISTNFLGNALENSLWSVVFALVGVALVRLVFSFRGIAQFAIATAAVGTAGYVIFMVGVDVPMYAARWHEQLADSYQPLGLFAGLYDLATRRVITWDIAQWRNEIPWMSLYFSAAVWSSLMLGGFPMVRHLVARYRVRPPLLKPARRAVAIPVRTP
jgi:hypothetical protein